MNTPNPIKNCKNIVVLTGAGISAESGIKTFRSQDGLWENHHVDDVATPEGFMRNPDLVQQFYNDRRKKLFDENVKPNAAHYALAQFEENCLKNHKNYTLITQNIDNLHTRAGSQNIIYMHGELLKVRCQRTGKIFIWENDIDNRSECPCCKELNTLRPHVVWFGEIPLNMDDIETALLQCDAFIAIGTSGLVYPAAGFCQIAKNVGAITVELNLEQSAKKNDFDHHDYGEATKIVPTWFRLD